MGVKDLIELCESLASSQGFYGRLLADLYAMSDEELNAIDEQMKSADLQTELDIILWLEG